MITDRPITRSNNQNPFEIQRVMEIYSLGVKYARKFGACMALAINVTYRNNSIIIVTVQHEIFVFEK